MIRFKNTDDVIQEIIKDSGKNNVTYESIGRREVDPEKIIALSREIDSGKYEKLEAKVEEEGWNDPSVGMFRLVELPSGEYVVSSGGNHRAKLARTLKREEKLVKQIGGKTIQIDRVDAMVVKLIVKR